MSAIIPAANKPSPLPKPDLLLSFVQDTRDVSSADKQDYPLSSTGQGLLKAIRDYISSMSRVIPCSATFNANLYTLTPNDDSPKLEGYIDYEIFVFTAPATSTGLVTATVVPANGSLPTIKVFKNNGAAQATTGDVVLNSVYMAIFADHLDSNHGGFVLK